MELWSIWCLARIFPCDLISRGIEEKEKRIFGGVLGKNKEK